jgi:cation diffusion facilitator CzcD-associated flavoprotein CzcO
VAVVVNDQEPGRTESITMEADRQQGPAVEYDVLVIGAGFSGIYALYHFGRLKYHALCLEAGEGPGGTWYWNRYPGARVDVESMQYSYSFDEDLQQEWSWSEHYSAQPDLEGYINHVVDRFDLRGRIKFGTRVNMMTFNEDTNRWTVGTDTGEMFAARFVIGAVGGLNRTFVPEFPGLANFKGKWYHTANWPKDSVDLNGKRVAVVGTGSSGVQVISDIADKVAHLFVFQRTANFVAPIRNQPMDPEYEREWKTHYDEKREELRRMAGGTISGFKGPSALDFSDEERERMLEEAWPWRGIGFTRIFRDVRTDIKANELVADFVRRKIRETVHDPEVAEMLSPTTHPIGTKRGVVSSNYYEQFNRDNVTLVDVREAPIVEVTSNGLRTAETVYSVDVIIFANGFDAMTGSFLNLGMAGIGGCSLDERWTLGPRTYLGMTIAGFPNFFMLHGPQSPSVLAEMIGGAQWQSNWIGRLLDVMRTNGYERVDTTVEAEDDWREEVVDAVSRSLYEQADSWYMGANVPGKPRVFMVYVGGLDAYHTRCEEIEAKSYDGFKFS